MTPWINAIRTALDAGHTSVFEVGDFLEAEGWIPPGDEYVRISAEEARAMMWCVPAAGSDLQSFPSLCEAIKNLDSQPDQN